MRQEAREASLVAVMDHAARRKKAVRFMGDRGLEGLMVTHLPDVRYLCGFSGSSGVLLLLPDKAWLVTDFRYREQARQEVVSAEVVIQENGFAEALRTILARHAGKTAPSGTVKGQRAHRETGGGAARRMGSRGLEDTAGKGSEGDAPGLPALGFDPERMTYAEVAELRRRLRGIARLSPLKSSLALLRAPKSRSELEVMRRGVRVAERAFREALRAIGADITETRLAAELDAAARRLGAEAPSFETIVASGKRGALVHARPSRARLTGAAVIDWGVVCEGYCTDCTRTLAFGRVPSVLRRAHGTVIEAQQRAMDRAGPGVRAREVDAAAREAVEKAGFGDAFGHGLGHGVGLEVHERPHVSQRSRDVLEEGMVFTVEPGIYLPGVGGVRVEDMAVVTSDGAELLTTLPRTLDPADYL